MLRFAVVILYRFVKRDVLIIIIIYIIINKLNEFNCNCLLLLHLNIFYHIKKIVRAKSHLN